MKLITLLNRHWSRLSLILIFAVMLGIMTDRLDLPWYLLNEDDAETVSQFARMHGLFGWNFTQGLYWFQPHAYPAYLEQPTPYLHSPPLLSWIIALTTSIFGDRPAVIRATMVALSFCLVWLFSRLISRLQFNRGVTTLTLLCFAWSPMLLFFGRNAWDQSIATIFVLLALLHLPERNTRSSAATFFFGLLAALSSFWPAVVAAVFFIWSWADPSGRTYRRGTFLFSFGIGLGYLTILFLAMNAVGVEAGLGNFAEAFFRRASGHGNEGGDFTTAMWFMRLITWNVRELTPVLIALGLAGAVISLRRWRTIDYFTRIWTLLLFSAFLFVFALKGASWVHRVYYFYLLPGMAALAGYFLQTLLVRYPIKRTTAWGIGITIALLFTLTSQPTVRIRYERDGRYPTHNPFINPPVIGRLTERWLGSQRPSPPIEWNFSADTSPKWRAHCQFWPDRTECARYIRELSTTSDSLQDKP